MRGPKPSCSQGKIFEPLFLMLRNKALDPVPPSVLPHVGLGCLEWQLASSLIRFAVCISRCCDAEHNNCWMILCLLLSRRGRCNWGWFTQNGAVFHNINNFGEGNPWREDLHFVQMFFMLLPAFNSVGREPGCLWQATSRPLLRSSPKSSPQQRNPCLHLVSPCT